jgi:hypothetical protein
MDRRVRLAGLTQTRSRSRTAAAGDLHQHPANLAGNGVLHSVFGDHQQPPPLKRMHRLACTGIMHPLTAKAFL